MRILTAGLALLPVSRQPLRHGSFFVAQLMHSGKMREIRGTGLPLLSLQPQVDGSGWHPIAMVLALHLSSSQKLLQRRKMGPTVTKRIRNLSLP